MSSRRSFSIWLQTSASNIIFLTFSFWAYHSALSSAMAVNCCCSACTALARLSASSLMLFKWACCCLLSTLVCSKLSKTRTMSTTATLVPPPWAAPAWV